MALGECKLRNSFFLSIYSSFIKKKAQTKNSSKLTVSVCIQTDKMEKWHNLHIDFFFLSASKIVPSIITRPNKCASMTARKDDSSPIKSIFCFKWPQKGHTISWNAYKTIYGHTRPQKVAQGPDGSCKTTMILSFWNHDFLFNWEQLLQWIFFVPFVTLFVRFWTIFFQKNIFCSHRSTFCLF